MYPNPASNQVTFEFSDPSTLQTSDAILSESSKNILNADPSGVKTGTVVETVDIKIYDKNQAIVLRSAGTTADQISIDTSLLASGIYYTHVTVGEKLYVRKLLIEGF